MKRFLLLALLGVAHASTSPVHTADGLVSGVPGQAKWVTVFKGIPFAAPPVGELRWKPAQPVTPWTAVRPGDKFGPACVQPHQPQRVPNNRAVDLPDSPPVSEDCLYLNVWTPARTATARLPVMVWIYGGAYTEGAGSTPYNQGDTLAAKGVIVVTFNYRLGALGFLAHPELTAESPHHASGNYALTDVLAALRWVQKNISAFGGNPGKVTIFGESAGAAMSAALVGTPQAAGLFQRAISESGLWMGLNLAPMRTRESAEQQTMKVATEIGAPSLAALRALSADDAATQLPKQGMIIDGWVIPEDLTRTFAEGRQNRVDILAGSNRDEGSFAPALGSAFAENMAWITRFYADRQRAIGRRAYVYLFVHEPPYAEGAHNLGVCHTCELPYVFDNLGALRLYPDNSSPELALASAKDVKVAAMTSAYWINFARSGDPNGRGLPKWPMFATLSKGPVMQLGEKPEVGDSLGPTKLGFYQRLYDQQFNSKPSSNPGSEGLARAVTAGPGSLGSNAPHDSVPALPGSDWEGYNKSLDGQRYSLLDQINTSNAANLVEVCRTRIAARGSLQSGLVVIDDSMFVTTATETFAIDPVSCRIKWQHSYRRSQQPGLSVNRGPAYLNGRIFRGTDDGRLVALDAATGTEVWTSVVGDASIGEYISGAPLAWNGLVIVGLSGGEFGIRGRIVAYDALTGREVWRFNTIPMGKEAGAETWGHSKWAPHGGGATWSAFTLDPVTAELFAPIGNPVPDFAPADRRGANLFTDSALVLDARTGALRWWYQLQANDDHDHDLAAAPLLFRNAKHEEMMAAAGKDGLLHVVDRASHQARFKTPITTVDPVRKIVTTEGVKVCPGPAGGVLWNGPAIDPRRMTIFVGAVDLCMVLKSAPGSTYVPRGLNMGGGGGGQFGTADGKPTGEQPMGWVTAVDANTGAVRWKYHADTPVIGGVTATAGGIVLTGDNAGNFLVFDSDNGKTLLKQSTGGALAGGVVTYARAGKQYIAFTSGNVSPTAFGAVGRPSVVVMALPTTAATATTSTTADPTRGKQIYTQSCLGCHGPDGDKVAGLDLKTVKSHMNAQQVTALILNPVAPMPKVFPDPRTSEDDRDLRDVAAFVAGWPP